MTRALGNWPFSVPLYGRVVCYLLVRLYWGRSALRARTMTQTKNNLPADSSETPHRAEVIPVPDDGRFPGSIERPALLMPNAFPLGEPSKRDPGDLAQRIEATFEQNGWTNGWRDTVFDYHHYHSTAHEVLGCYQGEASVQVGGPSGPILTLSPGDVLVLPAGAAHRRVRATADFRVVGCYAGGRDYDMNRGRDGERPHADENITRVPKPQLDPVYGSSGPLVNSWK